MNSPSPKDPIMLPQRSLQHSFLPNSTQSNYQGWVPQGSALSARPLSSLCPPTATGQGRKAPSKLWGWHAGPYPHPLLPASSPGVARLLLTRQPKLGSSFFLKPPTPGPKDHQSILLSTGTPCFWIPLCLPVLASYPVAGVHHHLPGSLTALPL